MHPSADRVVATRQPICIVRMQALHTSTGAADPTTRPWTRVVIGDHTIALRRITGMECLDLVGRDFELGPADTAPRFEPTDSVAVGVRCQQPIPSGHRCCILFKRRIPRDPWGAVGAPDHHLERGAGPSSEGRCHCCQIVIHAAGVAATTSR